MSYHDQYKDLSTVTSDSEIIEEERKNFLTILAAFKLYKYVIKTH